MQSIGIVDGYEDGYFRPSQNVSRVEFTKMVLLSHCFVYENENTQDISSKYIDMIPETWKSRVVEKADQLGIIRGYDDGTFRPDANITRAEALKILMRTSYLQFENTSSPTYKDIITPWQEPYIKSAELLGVLYPKTDGYLFYPSN